MVINKPTSSINEGTQWSWRDFTPLNISVSFESIIPADNSCLDALYNGKDLQDVTLKASDFPS